MLALIGAIRADQEGETTCGRVGFICYDNAMMESFWATLKTECFAGERPATRQADRLQVFDYIKSIYNRHRLHSGISYQSPLAFERTFSYNQN